jgi:hypothetical protein
VLQAGGGPDLTEEPIGAERVSQLGVEHFEGDDTVVLEIVREVHRGHSAAADLPLQGISVAKGICQRRAEGQFRLGEEIL